MLAMRAARDTLVVPDAGSGRNVGITESVIVDELASAALEWQQIRVNSIQHGCESVVDFSWRCLIVERSEVPVRISEHEILEKWQAELRVNVLLGSVRNDPASPKSGFAPTLQTRVVTEMNCRGGTFPELANRSDLWVGQTVLVIGSSTLQDARVEVTAPRILEYAILDAIELVARLVDSSADELRLGRRELAPRLGI